MVVLRPAATRGPLLHALRRAGATPVPLPALRLAPAAEPAVASAQLAAALAADRVVFTSPAAVRHARRLPDWRALPGERVIAVGRGTATALARAGVAGALVPGRSDSEGVLALPSLADLRGAAVGLVTAPGGRGLLAPALAARGARVHRADVYRRLPPRFDARHRQRVAALLAAPAAPRALLLTSLEALEHLLAGLGDDAARVLRGCTVVAASARLVAAARERGAIDVVQARSASPADLLDALSVRADRGAATGPAHAGTGAIR